MAAKRGTEESVINSIVGPGTFFRGHLELSGLLRIDGDFSGSVKTDGRVIVGQGGRADCAIQAGTVVIGGLFRGEILAFEKVVLLSSSIVIGTISAPRLVAEEGVQLSGRFGITGSVEQLVEPADLATRRKELLLESVRTRESSDAVRGEPTRDSNNDADAAPPPQARERVVDEEVTAPGVTVARGTSAQWNG
jgi:cytoskeletal protein CcmA (bactofilin family)